MTTILVCLAVISSCTNDDSESVIDSSEIATFGYKPKGEVTEITTNNGMKIFMDIDSTYFYGDVIFSKEQVEEMSTPRTRSAAIKSKSRYWPNKSINYTISSGFSTSDIATITNALSDITSHTNIAFHKVNNTNKNYILFVCDKDANFSPLGMQTGGNEIHIQPGKQKGIYLHEIMHSLGYFHEFTRTDRDNYVEVFPGLAVDGMQYNFEKYAINYDGYDIGTFDFNSVMMYDSYAFAKSNLPTMVKHGTGYPMGTFVANKKELSEGDIMGLKFIYGPEKLVNVKNIVEENNIGDLIEEATYSNTVYFKDKNGNNVTITTPRLIIIEHSSTTMRGEDGDSNTSSTIEYHIAPAGSSYYDLGETYMHHEEEGYGILRYHEEDYYSVYSY